MARDQVQVNPDGSGKQILAWSGSLDGATKYAQAIVNVDDTLTPIFPEVAALSDAYANPTATAVYSLGGVWNGVTWDRAASANAASNTTGAGLAGAGLLAFDGTNWQPVGGLAGDSGQNAVLVAGNRKAVTFSTTTNGVIAGTTTDCSNYRAACVQITGLGANANVSFQGSNDNATWANITGQQVNAIVWPNLIQSTTALGLYYIQLPCRYFRLANASQTSGTTAGAIEFFSMPSAPSASVQATLQTLGMPVDATIALTASAGLYAFNGTNWDRFRTANAARATTGTGLLGSGNLGQYNSIRPSVTSGNWEALQIDSGGNLKQNDSVFTYNHISTNATTTVKSGNGWLNAITINKPGSAWVLTIFDNTLGSGTTIGVLSPTAAGTIFYNVQFATGLTIVTSGTTAGDATVSYL